MGAGGAVAQRPRAAGVAGDDAADGARVARREVEAGVLAGAARGCLERRERRARADGHLPDRLSTSPIEFSRRSDISDLAVARNARADEPVLPPWGTTAAPGGRRRRITSATCCGVGGADDEPGASRRSGRCSRARRRT